MGNEYNSGQSCEGTDHLVLVLTCRALSRGDQVGDNNAAEYTQEFEV